MASNNVLQQLLHVLDDMSISPKKKADELIALQRYCEKCLASEFERKKDDPRRVYLCNFSKLQFPRSQELRSSKHYAVRYVNLMNNKWLGYYLNNKICKL